MTESNPGAVVKQFILPAHWRRETALGSTGRSSMRSAWAGTGLLWLFVVGMASANVEEAPVGGLIEQALRSDHREPANVARDRFRHPREVLEFFGLRHDMRVAEIWPSTGWWTEILAPVLREHGEYTAVGFCIDAPNTPAYRTRITAGFTAKLAADPSQYDRVRHSDLGIGHCDEIATPNSLDLVLTFRNAHNWLKSGDAAAVFEAAFRAMKPGGVLGLVDHRAPEGQTEAAQDQSGYVTESRVIAAAEAAGFKLDAKSEVNANPRDTADHPKGVWTLPPSLRLGEQDRLHYLAVGESDRMTLRFVKPPH